MKAFVRIACSFSVVVALVVGGQRTLAQSSFIPFVIPWSDSSAGSIVDVSFLNSGPAGENGYIVVKNGHLAESDTGRRIRFLGTNFTFQYDFPTHSDAALIAGHLAKLGINIVRIHHEDSNTGALWDPSAVGHTTLNADALDRLDYLIYQLKVNGIYVDLNLHVSRQFVPEDGFPTSVNDIPWSFDKGVDNFDTRMILLQKQFAKDYLTHVNPYTHQTYADDSAVAMIEINNENSLVSTLGENQSASDSIPEPFHLELTELWNAWLDRKYGVVDSLQRSWYPQNKLISRPSIELLSSSSPWTLEDQTKQASIVPKTSDAIWDAPSIDISVPIASSVAWHTQAHVAGLNLVNGQLYELSFSARGDSARSVNVYVSRDVDDWRKVGLDIDLKLTPEWRTYTYLFEASEVVPSESRISFVVGGSTGLVSVSSMRLRTATYATLPNIADRFASRSIEIPVTGSQHQISDWRRFLADTEATYATEMRNYLRKELHVHANVVDSQMEFGGLSSYNRESGSDLADNHAYWQHPSFPGIPWDSVNWTVENTPMVNTFDDGDYGTFAGLAGYRVTGKPYTITEYNHPAPSDFRSEMFPEFVSFAAAQDWDALFEFDYGAYGSSSSHDLINGFFSMQGDPAKEAYLPSAAMIFRAEEVDKLTRTSTLHIPKTAPFEGGDAVALWRQANAGHLPDIFTAKLQSAVDDRSKMPYIITTGKQIDTVDAPIKVLNGPSGIEYTVDSPQADVATGFLGANSIVFKRATFTFPAFGDNFASLTLVTMDGLPIATSHKLLLTILGKAENSGMSWNDTRTSVTNHWGSGPALAEAITADVSLIASANLKVWALDPEGNRTVEVPTTASGSTVKCQIGPSFRTVWYEITH